MSKAEIDRPGWLRLAAVAAIALLMLGTAIAAATESAGAKPSKGKSKGKGKATTKAYSGESRQNPKTSTVKAKFNASGVPTKIVKMNLTIGGTCTGGLPGGFTGIYSKEIPVKSQKKGKSKQYTFKLKISGPTESGTGTETGEITGTFSSSFRRLAIGFERQSVESHPGLTIECDFLDMIGMSQAGSGRPGKTRPDKTHGSRGPRGGKEKGHSR